MKEVQEVKVLVWEFFRRGLYNNTICGRTYLEIPEHTNRHRMLFLLLNATLTNHWSWTYKKSSDRKKRAHKIAKTLKVLQLDCVTNADGVIKARGVWDGELVFYVVNGLKDKQGNLFIQTIDAKIY